MTIGSIPERTPELQHPTRWKLRAATYSTPTRNAQLKSATWNVPTSNSKMHTQADRLGEVTMTSATRRRAKRGMPRHNPASRIGGLKYSPSSSLSRTNSTDNEYHESPGKLASALTVFLLHNLPCPPLSLSTVLQSLPPCRIMSRRIQYNHEVTNTLDVLTLLKMSRRPFLSRLDETRSSSAFELKLPPRGTYYGIADAQ
ncbi:hypothetical protein BJ166DRAFT_194051 [Pestalotiopsis sp. NC0098]|nr:hypothetical protein BJ166DRAFT_194051 [Pestalotiopsis sp. NC0098]